MRIDREIITSRRNRDVVEAAGLLEKKYREKTGLFRIDGIKLAREAAQCAVPVERVFLRESTKERVMELLGDAQLDCRATLVSDEVFDKLSDEKSPEGIICIAKHLDNIAKFVKIDSGDPRFSDKKRLFFAESVRDPGNLGTLVRSANALGRDRMVITSDCADLYNPKTLRASMGAIFRIEIAIVDCAAEAIAATRANGRRVFAAALDESAQKLGAFPLLESDCFIVGNEGHGLSAETVKACTSSVYIPMKAGAESLNAAAAAAVILWEQARELL